MLPWLLWCSASRSGGANDWLPPRLVGELLGSAMPHAKPTFRKSQRTESIGTRSPVAELQNYANTAPRSPKTDAAPSLCLARAAAPSLCLARAAAPSLCLARVEQPARGRRLLAPVRARRAALCIHCWRWPHHHFAHRARAVQHGLDGQVSRPERARTAAGKHAGGLSHPRALPRAAAARCSARWQHGPGGRQRAHWRGGRAVALTDEPHLVAGRDGGQSDMRGRVRPRDAPAARGRARLHHAPRPRSQGG